MIAYLITNNHNGKRYVGISKSECHESRWAAHTVAARIREAAKRMVLAGCLAIVICWPSQSNAQLATYDAASFGEQVKNLEQLLKSYATQVMQLQQEVQQVTWLATEVNSLIQNPNLGTVMALAGQLGLNTDLPLNPYAVQGLLNGYGGAGGLSSLTGRLSSLNGLVNGSFDVDHVYGCTTQSFQCQQQNQMALGTAGLKGAMGSLYQDLANHVQILQGLRTEAASATTPAERDNVRNEVNLENAWATNTGAQLQAVAALAMAQRQANENRANEMLNQDVSTFMQSIPANGG